MSKHDSSQGVHESLSPSDRETFLVFLRYPELDFEHAETEQGTQSPADPSSTSEADIDSSPLTEKYTTSLKDQSFAATDSTAHTTPTRLLFDQGNIEFGGWNEYIYLMQRSDLPQECLHYLTSLGQTVLNIGTILHSTLRPNQPSSVVKIGRWLLESVKYSSDQVQNQIDKIAQLELLTAFNVEPDATQAWATYRQRARQIAKNISLPSKRELGLIESLTFLYNAYVYHPFLQLHSKGRHDKNTKTIINDICHTLMTWLDGYKQWGKGMIRLRTRYLQPLVQMISSSAVAKQEFNDLQQRIARAKAAQNKAAGVDVSLAGEQVINNLNLSARKPGMGAAGPTKRKRDRYKRERTI